MSDPTIHIGMNIRKLRLEKQWTQQELGTRVNVSPQAVSKWENGSAAPDIELLPLLAHIFKVTVDNLFHPDCSPYADDRVQPEMAAAICPDCNESFLRIGSSCNACQVRWKNREAHCGVCHTTFKPCSDCGQWYPLKRKHCSCSHNT